MSFAYQNIRILRICISGDSGIKIFKIDLIDIYENLKYMVALTGYGNYHSANLMCHTHVPLLVPSQGPDDYRAKKTCFIYF